MNRFLQRAQEAAYGPEEYVEQESFVSATEIRILAERAGISARTSVLDLCCGVAGPGRLLTREHGCDYVGVDSSATSIELARERAGALPCRFVVARIPPLPAGAFDVVLLLETMLAFSDKATLFDAVARALAPGGRFAFTVEEGSALTEPERDRMPGADTVWLIRLDEIHELLERVGLTVRWQDDWSESHRATAASLADAYAADATALTAQLGRPAVENLLTAHRLWSDWLASGRVRKLAMVAERSDDL